MAMFNRVTTVHELLELTDGVLIQGWENLHICGADTLDSLQRNHVGYCDEKHLSKLDIHHNDMRAIFVPPGVVNGDPSSSLVLIGVKDPRLAFIKVLNAFAVPKPEHDSHVTLIHETAVMSPRAILGLGVVVGPFCVVGDAEIGAGTVLKDFVSIHDNVKIGKNCYIAEHTVIGKDGFGYQKDKNGEWIKFPHFGGVIIEDDVHLGASNCIDQGGLSPTVIGQGTKTDNMVHIAHNCKIGKRNVFTACAEVSGSVTTGDDCWFGPNSSILNGVKIGSNTFIGIRAVVVGDVADNQRIIPVRDTVKEGRRE